ncbi:MAG: peptidoglycan-binding protein [Clostridia bacterium]|nr:peptidoglycan-binding protein [Clostridia bacterium]
MRKNRLNIGGLVVIIILICAIFWLGVAALVNQQAYEREAKITPTPSITPRTVQITEDPAQPTSTPTPRLFQMNDVGIEVRDMQRRLKELGYLNGEADGQFGSATENAVKAFQWQHNLKNDGIAGEQTLNLLYSENARVFVPTPTPSPTPSVLSSGASGEEVRRLQTRLKDLGFYTGDIDGAFGKGTKSAVMVFQKQHDLEADGIAGAMTLKMLYSNDAHHIVVTPTPETIQVMAGSLPLLVNKEKPVGSDFIPADLVNMSAYCDSSLVKIKYDSTQGVREAVDALMTMLAAAKDEGITNWQVSAAYRSYQDQVDIMEQNVKSYMKNNDLSRKQAESAAKLTVAEPGTSEHHTGLAFDMTVPGTAAFKGTKQEIWLRKNCWDYGFIIRYTDEKQDITGFLGEEWHIRYVGVEHSKIMQEKDWCLEEYLQYVVLQ